jgi:hypothetical protein
MTLFRPLSDERPAENKKVMRDLQKPGITFEQ